MRIFSIMVLLATIAIGCNSVAKASPQLMCDTQSVRFAVYTISYPNFQGYTQTLISPIDGMPQGAPPRQLLINRVNDPFIAMAAFDPIENVWVLIGNDGGFVVRTQFGFFPIGRCGIIDPQVNLPPLGSLLYNISGNPGRETPPSSVEEAKVYDPASGVHWPMNAEESQAVDCASTSGVNNQEFLSCLNKKMLSESQADAIECMKSSANAFTRGSCIAKVAAPELSDKIDSVDQCFNKTNVDSDDASWKCLARKNMTRKQYRAYKCASDGIDADDVQDCAMALGVDEGTARYAATMTKCFKDHSDDIGITSCALSNTDNKDLTIAAKCVQEQSHTANFSYMSMGICYAGDKLKLNKEIQIAADCIVISGGQPYAFAGCTGGRLLKREIDKCFTIGVGGNGCFGRNNEIIKALRAQGIDLSNLNNPNGEVVKAWNTINNDLSKGPGQNNDVRKFVNNAIPDLTGRAGPNNEVVKAANNFVLDATRGPSSSNDAVKALNSASKGVTHLGGEVSKTIGKVFHF